MSRQASAAARKNRPPCVIALPGVNATGGSPSSRNAATSAGSGVTSASSYSGNPASSTCPGQSDAGGAYHAGHMPRTRSGAWMKPRITPDTAGSPFSARKALSRGAIFGSSAYRSAPS